MQMPCLDGLADGGGAENIVDHALPEIAEHAALSLLRVRGLLVDKLELDAIEANGVDRRQRRRRQDASRIGSNNGRHVDGGIARRRAVSDVVVVGQDGDAGLRGKGDGLEVHGGQDGGVNVLDGRGGGSRGVEGLHEGLGAVGDAGLGSRAVLCGEAA